jgi:EmrB/QacA subfamily drug resistance transporter
MTQAASATATPSKWKVLAVVGVGVFMCTLDSSIVNVSLPAIAGHFAVPVGAAVEWVVIAYLVVIASTLLTMGRLSDRVGRRTIWILGLMVFTAGSALCGGAPSLALLIAARVVQGIGGSMLMAVSPAMLVAAFPPQERGRALGFNAMVVAFGITAGPALGGAITQQASWRWIFYINLPIGIAGAVATYGVLPRDTPREARRFDVAGAVLLGITLGALATGLSVGNEVGWSSPLVLGLGAAVVVGLALFLVQARRHPAPVLDRSLFENRLFAWATISLVLSFLSVFAVPFLLPIYLQQLRGFDALETGLMLTPFPLLLGVVAPVSGHLADRFGTRWLAAVGMTIMCGGLLLLSRIDDRTSVAGVIWPQLVAALGMALFSSPNNSAIMGAAPRDRQGVAAGMLATGRTMGQSLSVAISGAVFGTLGAAAAGRALLAHPGDPALSATFVHGFHGAMLTSAAIAALAIATSLLRGRERGPLLERTDRR